MRLEDLAAGDVVGSYMKMKCRAASGESGMSVNVVRRESGRAGFWGERKGEGRGRRQERADEGEGHIYRFPVGREKPRQSSIFNKFIIPELDRRRNSEVSGQARSDFARSNREELSRWHPAVSDVLDCRTVECRNSVTQRLS